MKKILKSDGFLTILTSLLCIVFGLFIGYLVLLAINPNGAFDAIVAIVKNFMNYSSAAASLRYFGNTVVKTVPLILCSLSILFAYKAGLFNIGVAGQYCIGICSSLFCALVLQLPWYICILAAIITAALWGMIVGILKSVFNVNEVISGIMLNWIALYITNMALVGVKETASPYTLKLYQVNPSAIIPSFGLESLFNNNKYISIAIPLALIVAIVIMIVLEKTKFGYEIKATGFNRSAAKYCGMAEKRNVILTLMISAGLAGLGAALLYLTGFEEYNISSSSVPSMGFNGIAAAFLGGLNPIGVILSSFFIQHITSGGAYVDKTMYSSQITDLISAIIIYLCGFVMFIKMFIKSKQEAYENAKKINGGNK